MNGLCGISKKRKRCLNRWGFTLFELLVVIAMIAVISAVSIVGFDRGKPKALASAQSQVHAMLRATRGHAALNGVDARLLINFDTTDEERFLRYFGIVVRDKGDATKWIAVHRGMTLPEGIFFVPLDTATFVAGQWATTANSDRKSQYKRKNSAGDLALMNLIYPDADPQSADASADPVWIAYEFGPDGKLDDVDKAVSYRGGFAPVDSHIVLANGSRSPGGGIAFSESQKVKGIRIRNNGYSFAVNDPDGL